MHNNPSVANRERAVDPNVEAVIAWPEFSNGNPYQVDRKYFKLYRVTLMLTLAKSTRLEDSLPLIPVLSRSFHMVSF